MGCLPEKYFLSSTIIISPISQSSATRLQLPRAP